MSSKLTHYVWDHYPQGGSELLTALALAEHADPDGTKCFPSPDTVADMTRQSVRTVMYHIAHMLEIGWLVVVKRGGGRGNLTEYRIPIERIPKHSLGTMQKLHRLEPQPADETSVNPAGFMQNDCNKSAKRASRSTGTSTRTSTAAAAQLSTVPDTPTPANESVENPNGAAAACSLRFPEKLSGSDCSAARALLQDVDDPQLLLDELEGAMGAKRVNSPLALLKTFAAQRRAGQFAPSHAHRVQAERELAEVTREAAAARAAGHHT